MNENELAMGGDVEISKIKLYNYKGLYTDIQYMFTEIELYENIYEHSLSGTITMVDTHNLIKAFPIIGEENLELVFKTPGFSDEHEISHTFKIWKLDNIFTPTPHKQIYTLHFTTPEAYTDKNIKLFKAYNGTPSSIISQILNSDIGTKKKSTIGSCNNNIKFVAPSMSPFRSISYLTSRAQTVDGFKASDFLFYENNKEYRLDSVNDIFDKAGDPSVEFIYNNDPARDGIINTSVRSVESELSKVYEYNIDFKFDIIDRYNNGFYSHFVWEHNLLIKKLTKRGYHYNQDFSKTKHLEDSPISSDNHSIGKNTVLSTVTTYPQIHDGIMEDNFGKIITNKIPLLEQLRAVQIDIKVHGRTDLAVGKVIKLKFTGMEVQMKDDTDKVDDKYDGKYLIVAMAHRITAHNKHAITMRLARESVKDGYK